MQREVPTNSSWNLLILKFSFKSKSRNQCMIRRCLPMTFQIRLWRWRDQIPRLKTFCSCREKSENWKLKNLSMSYMEKTAFQPSPKKVEMSTGARTFTRGKSRGFGKYLKFLDFTSWINRGEINQGKFFLHQGTKVNQLSFRDQSQRTLSKEKACTRF